MNRIRTMIMLAGVTGIVTGCLPMAAQQPVRELHITLVLPEATEVMFLSSLNRYEPVLMNKTSSGTWEIHLPEEDSFDYFFRVDGSPYTPECRLRQTDDWGGCQCIYSPEAQKP